jgi:hypothetical protein
MGFGERRKSSAVTSYFVPTGVTGARQHYCSAPACRAASKTAGQARWLVPAGPYQ